MASTRPALATDLSYLHLCQPDAAEPTDADYPALKPYFDAELRAITADVLLPVGDRTTAHVLAEFTARRVPARPGSAALHATDLRGSGWLVVPIKDSIAWRDGDATRLVSAIQRLRDADSRQLADLGRFMPDDSTYFAR